MSFINIIRYILCRLFGICQPPRPVRDLQAVLNTDDVISNARSE